LEQAHVSKISSSRIPLWDIIATLRDVIKLHFRVTSFRRKPESR
jgi:hypothetical protein